MMPGAASATYVKSGRDESGNANNEAYLRYAHGIVSEYLMDDLSQKLLKYLNLPEDTLKRKSVGNNLQSLEPKKMKLGDEDKVSTPPPNSSNVLDLSKAPQTKGPTGSSKDKARSKAAVGSKSIASFFRKS